MLSESTQKRIRGLVIAVVFAALAAAPAFGHKVGVFALVNDGVIEGEAYSSGEDTLKNCIVTLLGPDGEKLGETRTQADGTFRFKPTVCVEHMVVVDTGDGHRAEFRVSADELTGTEPVVDQAQIEEVPTLDDIEHHIAHAVAREILPLRRQIDQYERKTRLRDIVAGIGYIFGLAGVVLYFKAGKRRSKSIE